MRRGRATLWGWALSLALMAVPAVGQTLTGADGNVELDVSAVATEVMRLYNSEGGDASFRYLDATMRDARGKGWLDANSGVLFAMYTDALRNLRLNPAYALRVADEGLALIRAGHPQDPRDAMLLEVSRAYALADLGRFEDAVEAGTLAMPAMRDAFGTDKTTDDLASYIAEWKAGHWTAFNTSALDMARKALDRAEAAMDRSDNAAVLSEAARAILPPGSGFGAGDVALLTAEARSLSGRALYLMRRPEDAKAVLLAGAETLFGPDWFRKADPQPLVPVPDAARERITQLFYWLARTAIDGGDRALAEAALPLAERYAPDSDWQGTVLFGWMQLAVVDGDRARVDRLIDRVVTAARADNREDFARLAEFYRATSHASIMPTWDAVDVVELVRTARAALDYAVPGSSVDGGFVEGELASFLVQTGNLGMGIEASRAAIMEEMMRRGSQTGPEAAAHATRMRSLAEMHLYAAHALDSRRPEAVCFDKDDGRGCVIFVMPRE